MAAERGVSVMVRRSRAQRRSNVERTAFTRRLVTSAAVDILASKGFSALSNSLITSRAAISSGALMHHFPKRSDLLVATVESAYATLTEFRRQKLQALEPGLPRLRAIIDLAWVTARMPEGIAVNEVRIGVRCDSTLARAMSPALTFIAVDYGRFVGRQVREAGLKATPDMQGLWAATAMAVRSLAIDRTTYQSEPMIANVLLALRTLREDLIARQLGEKLRVDPSIAAFADTSPPATTTSRKSSARR